MGQEDQDEDDDRSAYHVPPHRGVVEDDSRWLEKMLTREAMNRIPRKNRKIVWRLPECQLVKKNPRVRSKKVAQP